MNWRYILIVFILACLVGGGTLWFSAQPGASFFVFPKIERTKSLNERFRDSIVRFAREVAEAHFEEGEIGYPKKLEIEGDWDVEVTIYHQGENKGQGEAEGEILSLALEQAVNSALRKGELVKEELENARFLVDLHSGDQTFSSIEYKEEGKEVIDDLVIVRELDKDLILERIQQGKEFLYRMEHEDKHGFYKRYEVLTDNFEERLHTVYSASIIYTFLYIYDLDEDEEILEHLSDWGDFLLFMQNKDKEDKRYGAFPYSYYLDTEEKEQRYVVGTSALNIFTLLRLYDLTGYKEYLESAKMAGDWLTTMQKTDGVMKAYVRYSGGKWLYGTKESLLYNGQVLSSLSKLYAATNDKKYYDSAKRIADHFAEKYEKERGYVEGEYRSKNPISNSWIVMSLLDFYKVDGSDRYKDIVFELSEKVLANQRNDPDDVLYHGGWIGAYSTSGIGWISEVMSETYRFCSEEGESCEKYKEAVIKGMRWVIQNTYSEENNFLPKNPEKALGGVFWNKDDRYVRTDSVCHALNGYIRIMDYLEDKVLISIPEEPFK